MRGEARAMHRGGPCGTAQLSSGERAVRQGREGKVAACVAGAEVLGILEWPWRVGTVPCRLSPPPEHLRLQCQEAGPERAPEKRQRAERGLQG